MSGKVAIVTGANKGIGLAIVRELCRRGVETVYLTARDEKRGAEAVNALKLQGYYPILHQLDVSDENSVRAFADYIKQNHKGVDIVVNNAGVISSLYEANYEEACTVINTNFNSILRVEEHLFPLLNDNARVINVSSDCGHLSNLKNTYWIQRLKSENATLEDVQAFTNWYLDSLKDGTFKKEDFNIAVLFPYVVSKVAISAYTRVQQRNIGRNVSINSIHPGFVITGMTKGTGMTTVGEACKAPVYLALDADQEVKGKYIWFDKTEKDWEDAESKFDYADPAVVQEFLRKMAS